MSRWLPRSQAAGNSQSSARRRRVLVAGATGYLGRFVAEELKSRGHTVRVLARDPRRLDRIRDQVDEVAVGEVTVPYTIQGICDNIDVVFSSIGITKQKDGLTFRDVDYQGNKNLLDVALAAGVRKFIYVSVFNGPVLTHLDIVRAHEDFVRELRQSGMDYAVIRPTGYFSDLEEFLRMAERGRVYIVGSGKNRINPIHGADLAVSCVDAMDRGEQEVDVGGPEVLTYRQIAELALETCGKPVRVTSLPAWAMRFVVAVAKRVNRHKGGLLDFFVTGSTIDFVAPSTGTHTLREH